MASFQRGIERQKELNLEDSIKEETDEEISKEYDGSNNDNSNSKENKKSSSSSFSDVSAPDTPRAPEECAEFVDNVFKPVFSIT